ncbi:putative jacalin domain protein [Rhizoctonia solani 123E]|uniref:Putative jacalin domain protein n=1 Tax=Rhizoctonia solani 123E TaxID=1423351 RepID=A0A074RMM9_9AGAM|nr:putative jacalin domain protein [Rhizoctonia solani 123E]
MEQTDATRIFEDDYSSTKLDALYAHSGWSPFATLPDRPWAGLDTSSHIGDSGRWVTRRMLVSMWSTDFEVDNLSVADAFVSAVEGALAYHNDVSRMCALEEVFASWGDVIPMAAIVGCTITATGLLLPDTNLEPVSSVSEPVNPATFRDLNGFIDTQLQIQGKFERTLKYHVTGGRPDILLRQGFDAWLDNIKTTQGWDIIKVTKVIPITDILDHAIQQRIKQLYANRNVFFRSPSIGGSSQFGFEGDGNGLYLVRRIEIGFSNECIESLSIRYADGAIAGPYGLSGNTTRLDTLVLAQGEFVTDIFIWPTDHFIASLQLVKNTGYVSPIYGATRGITQPLRLLNGNGKALAGLSGGYDNVGITQLQAVWRRDLEFINYERSATTFIGGEDGDFWNDLSCIGDRSSTRISGITARSPGAGYLSDFQTTYTSLSDGYPAHQESPVHGTEDGPVTSWTLEGGQYITGVRGRHDGASICELQFTTNQLNQASPAFGKPCGNFDFNFTAPQTEEGNEMILHYMAGKSAGRVNSILFVWVDPGHSVQESNRAGGGIFPLFPVQRHTVIV